MPGIEGEEFRKTIRDARHESVTSNLLGKESRGLLDARVKDGALITHLRQNEQPHFIFRGQKETPEVYGSLSPKEFSRSRRYKVFHIVTDRRWLSVVGNRRGDQTLSIQLESISDIDYEKDDGILPDIISRSTSWRVAIETELGFVEVPINDDLEEADLRDLGDYLASTADVNVGDLPVDSDEAGYTIDGIETYEPSQATIANLLDEVPGHAQDEANELVRESEDASTLVRELKTLIEEHENEEQSIDDVVANAEDADELRSKVASRSDKVRSRAEHGLEEVQTTFRESDPEEVGEFAL